MVLVLECGDERRLAVYHTKLIQSEWQATDDCKISLKGLNLDDVWNNIVVQVGSIEVQSNNSLEEQIILNAERERILKEIAKLEAQARKESQPKKKFELVQRIQQLQKEMK